MPDCRLAATDLACRRGDRVLFSGLSFTLEAGQAVQIAGTNGVGKSSLIRLLAGLRRPLSGEIERSGIAGLIDDHPALDPHLPLRRALAFWSGIDRTAPELARLGLAELGEVPVRYLSTGQRKRAALARLIGQGAPIWLLDEPLNGLDREAAMLVEALAAEHCGAGGICVVASHQPFALAGMARIELADFAA